MSQEWYYEDNGNRAGPVTPAVLKQLADAGGIRPDTRVWRQGMAQWAPAKAIKGLFPGGLPASPSPSSSPAPVTASSLPSPPRAAHAWHPLDVVIDTAREKCPPNLAATLSRFAGQAGTLLLYAAAILVPIAGLLISTRTGAFRPFVAGIALGVGLIALQYVGVRLLGACDSAIQASTSVLPSLAIPDCAFVLCVIGTLVGAITLIGVAISAGELNAFFAAIALLAIGGFTALVAIDPAGINVAFDLKCGAGQEAVGVLTFFVKVFLRCAPIAFAASVAFSTWGVVSFVFDVLRASSEEMAFMVGFRSPLTATMLLAAAAVPVYAYVLLLFYYLTLDVLSAIVSIPRKLDAIADGKIAGQTGDKT
jgi:hypothetical protein